MNGESPLRPEEESDTFYTPLTQEEVASKPLTTDLFLSPVNENEEEHEETYSSNQPENEFAVYDEESRVEGTKRGSMLLTQPQECDSDDDYPPSETTNLNELDYFGEPIALEPSHQLEKSVASPLREPLRPLDDADSSSSDDDESSEAVDSPREDLNFRRARNERRNQQRWLDLGSFIPKASTESSRQEEEEPPDLDMPTPTGMLVALDAADRQRPTPETPRTNADENDMDDLCRRYPCRGFQIKTLAALIRAAMTQPVSSNAVPYVPPPIFVSGPSGTGKTSVVRNVVNNLKEQCQADVDASTKRIIGSAYVNCATIEPSSVEAVLESAYDQLTLSIEPLPGPPSKKRKRKRASFTDFTEANDRTKLEMKRAELNQKTSLKGTSSSPVLFEGVLRGTDTETLNERNDGNSDRVSTPLALRETRSRRHATNDVTRTCVNERLPESQRTAIKKVEAVSTAHAAPMAFGRYLAPYFGSTPPGSNSRSGSAIFVLDHAERLFSFSPKQRIERNNFLAQLLLLPQVMGLNLTFVIVSRSTLLCSSRINNAAAARDFLGSLRHGIAPIRIHFPAYNGTAEFKPILKQPENVQRIVGRRQPLSDSTCDERRSGFQEDVVESFLDTVIQSVSSVTRDVREMIRIGRMLWPAYVQPLDPQQIRKTLAAARRKRNARRDSQSNERAAGQQSSEEPEEPKKEVLAILDESLLPVMRKCLEEDLFALKGPGRSTLLLATTGSSVVGNNKVNIHSDLPYLSKCLLLATFICQANKSDKDRILFTIQRNGKKNNRQGHRSGDNDTDAAAYGSEQQELKVLRPRSVSLERMLSVFTNIVGLIGGEEKLCLAANAKHPNDLLRSMGSACFFESLARLREIGLLHELHSSATVSISSDEYSVFDGVNLSSTKYWCELDRDDAEVLAESVELPLANVLL